MSSSEIAGADCNLMCFGGKRKKHKLIYCHYIILTNLKSISFDIFSEIVAIFVTVMNILFVLVLPSDKQFENTVVMSSAESRFKIENTLYCSKKFILGL